MKIKNKVIFSAALVAALIMLPRAQALTGDATMTNTSSAAATNGNPADAMAALFGDPVIAKGNGFEIKQSQMDAVMDALKARNAAMGQTIPLEELEKTVLTSLIVNEILLQKATDADKAAGKKDADQYIAQKIKQFGSRAALDEQLTAAGKTFNDWSNQLDQQTTATAVMIRELNATPTAAEIQKYYDDHPAASELPEQVHVRHILLLTIDPTTHAPLPDDQIQAKKKQIDDILKQLRAGADFATLAKEYSEDPGSKDNGGEMPPFSRNDPVAPEFMAAAFSLTNNQISDVVTTQFGYHIIQLLDKTPARKLALTDKLPSDDDMTVADYLKESLTGQTLQEQAPAYIEKISKTPGVEILDPALKALLTEDTNAPVTPAAPAAAPAAAPQP